MLSGFKNVFRRYIVKKFTPMTRALAESILDPNFIIYGYFRGNKDKLHNFKFYSYLFFYNDIL